MLLVTNHGRPTSYTHSACDADWMTVDIGTVILSSDGHRRCYNMWNTDIERRVTTQDRLPMNRSQEHPNCRLLGPTSSGLRRPSLLLLLFLGHFCFRWFWYRVAEMLEKTNEAQ